MSQPPQPDPPRQCLVLDIDETLLFGSVEMVGQPGAVTMPCRTAAAVLRPHVEEFLDFCFDRFAQVALWTAAAPVWLDFVVTHVLAPRPWAFTWHRSRCVTVSGHAPATVLCKPLSKVWAAAGRRAAGWTRTSTIIVDDVAANAVRNRGNAITVPSFRGDTAHDDALRRLQLFLDMPAVRNVPDVRAILPLR
jgi:TFIIF-interacting CTD phosphatase-like protein